MVQVINFFHDTHTMLVRNLLRLSRTPQILVFSTIQPILFVVLFNAVFSGSIGVPGFSSYINYLIPGIMIQTAVFGSTNTGVGLAEDLEKGAIDRFRSLPISRASILFGRTTADSLRTTFVMLVVFIAGFVFGFRPDAGWGLSVSGILNGTFNLIAAMLLVVFFASAIQWMFVYLALFFRNVEAVQAASFAPIFPLVFAASTFAPVYRMPTWIRGFAANQPVSVTVDSVRAILFGSKVIEPGGNSFALSIGLSLFWSALIFGVFSYLSIKKFNKDG